MIERTDLPRSYDAVDCDECNGGYDQYDNPCLYCDGTGYVQPSEYDPMDDSDDIRDMKEDR